MRRSDVCALRNEHEDIESSHKDQNGDVYQDGFEARSVGLHGLDDQYRIHA